MTSVQIQHDGWFRYDCLECGRELLFPRLCGDHPGTENVRAFCSKACAILWGEKHPDEAVDWSETP